MTIGTVFSEIQTDTYILKLTIIDMYRETRIQFPDTICVGQKGGGILHKTGDSE